MISLNPTSHLGLFLNFVKFNLSMSCMQPYPPLLQNIVFIRELSKPYCKSANRCFIVPANELDLAAACFPTIGNSPHFRRRSLSPLSSNLSILPAGDMISTLSPTCSGVGNI